MKRFLFLLLLLFAAPAFAQSDETMRHAATMKAVSDLAAAMKAQAETIDRLAARVGAAPVVYKPAVAPVAEEKPCEGFGGCLVAGTKAVFSGVGAVVRGTAEAVAPLAPFAQARYGFLAVKEQGNTARWQATEARLSNADNQATLQAAFGGFTQIGLKQPQPAPPTTQNIFTSNTGPILVGSGSMDNSLRPAPTRYCFPVYGSNGNLAGSSCI